MEPMTSITSPALIVDEEICRNNIRRMVRKAARYGLEMKPHMKTHQSAAIGQWFRNEGVENATVSSVDMAEYFARHGWRDITVAFPCNIREIPRITRLAENLSLSLLVNNSAAASQLDKNLKSPVDAYIEIDTGSGRTGFPADGRSGISRQIEALGSCDNLHFRGFYSHPGHSYSSRSVAEIREVHRDVQQTMSELKSHFSAADRSLKICVGDTPCCSKGENFDDIDEISPGNFVFYDLTQVRIGSCDYGDIATAVACPVVEKYPERQELAIHGGAVHFSKDRLQTGDKIHYGAGVTFTNGRWSTPPTGCRLSAISQEHGILSCNNGLLELLSPGDLVGILPVHSCLTADLMGGYLTTEGTVLSHMRNDT